MIQELEERLEAAEQVLLLIALERENINAPGPRDWLLGVRLVERAEEYFTAHPRPKQPTPKPKNQNYLENKITAAELHAMRQDRRRKGDFFLEGQ